MKNSFKILFLFTEEDNQVSRAIDLIRGISLFSNKINNISKNSLSSKK